MKKYLAELVGTFILVLFGCGTAVIAGDKVGIVGIAFAFGLGLVAAAYGIGPISGCHINPAVSLGVCVAGRMSVKDMIGYWVGQFVGAILAAWVLLVIAVGTPGYSLAVNGLGQDGWGPGYQGGYNIQSAILFEFVATADLRDRDSGLDAEECAGGICRAGHRHHVGGDSHLRHSYHGRKRESGAEPGAGAVCGRPGAQAVVALPGRSQRGRHCGGTAVPHQAAGGGIAH